jgi:hypothetical protein
MLIIRVLITSVPILKNGLAMISTRYGTPDKIASRQ